MHMVNKETFLAVTDRYVAQNLDKVLEEGEGGAAVHFDTQGTLCAISVSTKNTGSGFSSRVTYYVRGCLIRRLADEALAKVEL